MRNGLNALVTAGAMLCASSAFAVANSLSVSSAAALNGTANGLEVICAGADATNVSVESDHPQLETHYKAKWLMRPGTLQLPTSKVVRMGQIITPGGQTVLIFLRRTDVNNWALKVKVKDENDPVYVALTNLSLVVSGSELVTKKIGLEWQAGDNNANNGFLKVWRCDTITSPCEVGDANVVRTSAALENDTLKVDKIRFGLLLGTGVNCSGNGAYHFDEFESYR